jgi:hypothetical protein
MELNLWICQILRKAELGFFHFLEIVTGWLADTFHRKRSRLLKTGFFTQVGKGAENTKEKSRQCFTQGLLVQAKNSGKPIFILGIEFPSNQSEVASWSEGVTSGT